MKPLSHLWPAKDELAGQLNLCVGRTYMTIFPGITWVLYLLAIRFYSGWAVAFAQGSSLQQVFPIFNKSG